jgi:hypothetical protein
VSGFGLIPERGIWMAMLCHRRDAALDKKTNGYDGA